MSEQLPAGEATTFEVLMDAAVDAIIIIDDQGEILRFNPAAQRMFGYPADYVHGKMSAC